MLEAFALHTQGRNLEDAVLTPTSKLITEARRLVVMPDGPLWSIPFAALPNPTGDGAETITRDFSHPYFWAPFQVHGDWR